MEFKLISKLYRKLRPKGQDKQDEIITPDVNIPLYHRKPTNNVDNSAIFKINSSPFSDFVLGE